MIILEDGNEEVREKTAGDKEIRRSRIRGIHISLMGADQKGKDYSHSAGRRIRGFYRRDPLDLF